MLEEMHQLDVYKRQLAHSITHDKQRIFFVMPLLSIIEQNSTAIQRTIGDSSLILEHHSNMVREAGCSEDLSLRELLMENWDAPITVTTLVQFLETLFSGKTSAIRRFRSLCSSVIVIDEVQTCLLYTSPCAPCSPTTSATTCASSAPS